MDTQKIQLVGIETEKGVHYDLWYPGYAWAETKGLWLPPGLIHSNTVNHHEIRCPALSKAIQDLNTREIGPCEWRLFPIVAATLDENNEKQESHLPLETGALAFQKLFAECDDETLR